MTNVCLITLKPKLVDTIRVDVSVNTYVSLDLKFNLILLNIWKKESKNSLEGLKSGKKGLNSGPKNNKISEEINSKAIANWGLYWVSAIAWLLNDSVLLLELFLWLYL